uniref:Transmembrane protein n=1 Tax=Caenorhabditis japonica TaxID=281687 RepID=A0A8R1I383_CAEJA
MSILIPAIFTSISLPVTIAVHSVLLIKCIHAAIMLTVEILIFLLSISFDWLWEVALNTEIIDAIAVVLSIWISTSVLLDIFSYEIVITGDSDENIEYDYDQPMVIV